MARATEQTPPPPAKPALWYEPAPRHFDLAAPWWIKSLAVVACTAFAFYFLDQRVAVWARDHAFYIPDLAGRPLATEDAYSTRYRGGDIGRELMFLEQWGQFSCTVLAIAAVGLIDPKGRRRALSIAIACVLTVCVTHLLKDLFARSRPFNIELPTSADGSWVWAGPAKGFSSGSRWASFPSAHTTSAFALAAGLAWYYPRGRYFFMGLATTTATLRVLHYAHYVSDVIAGMGIGVFVARATISAKLAGRYVALTPRWVRAWYQQNP